MKSPFVEVDLKKTKQTSEKSKNSYFNIENPYHAYDIESGEWFYHENLINKIRSIFEGKNAPKMIIVQGQKGSGKTSTLCKLEANPDLLGSKFRTTYIDYKERKSADKDAYLSYIYYSILKRLKKYEMVIDFTDYFACQKIALADLTSFIRKIESTLPTDTQLLIIFDEFDTFLRKANISITEEIISFIKFILEKTSKVRLLLAGERQISGVARKANVHNLFDIAISINIEDIIDFETQKIKKLIIDPVKGHINYDNQAIKYIIDITGKNLYIQQLLCYYIFNYLGEIGKNNCNVNDVHQAMEKMLSDDRPDLVYFWDTFECYDQLIISALADEKITHKRGSKYFIEDATILNTIFGEEVVLKHIHRLADDRQINRIDGPRFDDNPFTVPVCGEWVRRNHSFFNTVIDNWKGITDYVSIPALTKIMELLPKDKIPLKKEIVNSAIQLFKIWMELSDQMAQRKTDHGLIEECVKRLCGILNFEILEKPDKMKTHFRINVQSMNLGGIKDTLLFVPDPEMMDELDAFYIQDEILRQDKPSNPSYILCLQDSEKIHALAKKQFLGLILLNETDIKKIACSSRPSQNFKREIVLKRIKPSFISSYQTEGIATVSFYGRHDEISRIVQSKHKNFAVVGARKIGKTSLLHKIKEDLPSNICPIYIDLECPPDQNYQTFLDLLQEKMSYTFKWMREKGGNSSNLREVITRLCQQTTVTPLFILDEIDSLLAYDRDNGYQLIRTLRALFNEGLFQIIMSGYEVLYHEKYNIDSPLYNFCQTIPLDKLKTNEALDLITHPMEGIGIDYENSEDRMKLLEYTSQHPNLLQAFCTKLIEKLEIHDEKDQRTIFKKDIEAVYQSIDYEKYVVEDFYLFNKDEMHHIEMLIVLFAVEQYPKKKEFSAFDFSRMFKKHEIDISTARLDHHLDNLMLRFILKGERGAKYSFALPVFAEMLKRRNNINELMTEKMNDAKKSLRI